jgi:hypothetical protein
MAKAGRSTNAFAPNERLQKALSVGPDNVSVLRGFIGETDRDGYIRLHPSLSDTSVSVDVARDDIIDTGDVPDNTLGKRFVLIKKGARITVTKTRTTEYGNGPTVSGDEMVPIRAGRLTMQLRKAALDTCVSVCSCQTCESHCTNWCGVCTCIPQTKAQ